MTIASYTLGAGVLSDAELDAVTGGDKTMGQVAAKVILGKELPDPPPPLQPGGAEIAFTILGILAL